MPDQLHAQLRRFLVEAFADLELVDFCFDYFPVVYNDFAEGMRKSQKARMLVDHCLHQERIPDLIAALNRERPAADLTQLLRTPSEPAHTHVTLSRVRNLRQIFISHAHQDVEFARRLTADLRAHSWQIWIAPDSIFPGEKWVEAINRGLEESGVFLLLISPHAVTSRWVTSETDVAIEMEHEGLLQFIPAQIQKCALPPLWRAYQRLYFDRDYAAALQQLLARLNTIGAA